MNIACIGECMIEIATLPGHLGQVQVGFGGDTLNTAIYLSRLFANTDHKVHYFTVLGDDPYADSMLTAWIAEGIDCRDVEQDPGRETGLYTINVDKDGERSFHYWRSQAPARELFAGATGLTKIAKLATFDAIYFSGISLAILHEESRDRLLELAEKMKDAGRHVIYDTNFRERLWAGQDAQEINTRALKASTLALPSDEDLCNIFNQSENEWKSFLEAYLIPNIILKKGGAPLDIFQNGKWQSLSMEKATAIVDTTAAGDSFNAGYIAARSRGDDPIDAVKQGHKLACTVIGHSGAIIPLAAMPLNANASESI